MPEVRITVDDEPALTVVQAAERHGIESIYTVHSILRRAGLTPAGHIDGRTPLYLTSAVDSAIADRPGKGRRQQAAPA